MRYSSKYPRLADDRLLRLKLSAERRISLINQGDPIFHTAALPMPECQQPKVYLSLQHSSFGISPEKKKEYMREGDCGQWKLTSIDSKFFQRSFSSKQNENSITK